MATISLCMIVKNEEKMLARCLESVQTAVDEIIIVDTGSTDETKQIARRFTSKIYDFEWVNDFAAARNFAFSKATMDYQMWLDADDVMPPEERKKLMLLKETLSPETDIVMMKYNLHFDEDGRTIMSSMRERLLKRSKGYRWADPVHEYILLNGNVLNSSIAIDHRKPQSEKLTDRNLQIYEELRANGAAFSPRQLYYYARELRDHSQFEKAIFYFKKFLATNQGWVEDNIEACRSLSHCYKKTHNSQKALDALLHSFTFDAPRAETVCAIAYFYKEQNDYTKAAAWFRIAAALEMPATIGFTQPDYWGFVPHIELSVCYDALGNTKKAIYHNEQAAKIKPNHPSVKANRQYFEQLKKT